MLPNLKQLFSNSFTKVIVFIYLVLTTFWVWMFSNNSQEGLFNNLYGAIYPLISLIGGLYGIFVVSKKWGGYRSVIGRGVYFLSLGLLAQVFGQWAWSYYTIIQKIEVPYPSVADIGYFAIIPLYSYAMYNFAKAAGIEIGLKSFFGKIQAIVVPLVMVGIAYFLFLRDIPLDLSDPLRTFLDFGYPGFEIIAVSLAMLTYSLSHNIYGGILRPKILFIVFALIFQYVTDYLFLYQVGAGTYYNGGIVDLLYASSFMIMALGIIQFGVITNNVKSQNEVNSDEFKDLVGNSTTNILTQIILAIIKRQEKVAGAIAWEEAKSVEGLRIVDQNEGKFVVTGDFREVINKLVGRYRALFGDLAVQVSKDAAQHFVATLPAGEVPEILK